MGIYLGADGQTYTEQQLWKRYEAGSWRFCMGDASTGRELVETADGQLLMLTPADQSAAGTDRAGFGSPTDEVE